MDFLPQEIEDYVLRHTSPESEILAQLNRETHLKVLQPRMLSGHLQGQYLQMLSKLLRPKNILEIGTYTGYSAICLSAGLQDDGKLITIDNNRELEGIHQRYLLKIPNSSQIEVLYGNALDLIPDLPQTFDLVFIDADKENYSNYLEAIFERVNVGGLILADNVLWSGKVVKPVKENDKSTRALLEFNERVQRDERFENMLLPLRDGLMMIRKK